MPRFVLLYHDCPPDFERASHWDLMLESGDVLRTWALEKLPRAWEAWWERTTARYPNCTALSEEGDVVAMPLGDHRRSYLEFEGELSGGRGGVVRIARGEYVVEEEASASWLVSLREGDLLQEIRLPCS